MIPSFTHVEAHEIVVFFVPHHSLLSCNFPKPTSGQRKLAKGNPNSTAKYHGFTVSLESQPSIYQRNKRAEHGTIWVRLEPQN